ncbi:dual specificity phosphatase [Nitzschia inconspicua]|uniref:protein-tyrosine-phosphatase n=1 Tax=Nitzschia inconspicua TaxID=303405 RepID=A0A9K3K5J4_9STRA|nr:dual specificity phosphatase [Nitzschia inconspicua]KAG7368241.1 dual specificity phosphatase [Nitzschia inconspicua]
MGQLQSRKEAASDDDDSTSRSYEYQPEDWPWVWAIRDPDVLGWRTGLSKEEIFERQNLQHNLPVHIYGKVYLGSAYSVQDLSKLKKLGIRRVLNMAGPMALKKSTILAYKKEGFDYKRINALDEDFYPLLANDWKEAHDYIHDPDQDGNVVVHCVAGLNRSALVVAVDYMLTNQKPVLETVRHIRWQRGDDALQNEYFQEQLVAMARQSDLLGKVPGTQGSILENAEVKPENSFPPRSRRMI